MPLSWLMIQVAAAALVVCGVQHARQAVAAAAPSNDPGDSNAWDIQVLECALPALGFFSIAGAASALGLPRSSRGRSRLLNRVYRPFFIALGPILIGVLLVPHGTAGWISVWGAMLFATAYLVVMRIAAELDRDAALAGSRPSSHEPPLATPLDGASR